MAARKTRKALTTRKKSGTKNKAKRRAKASWGGRRAGAGRPVGSGTGPSPDSRRNRIAVMLSDKELKVLQSFAKAKKLPIATAVYELVKPKLRRKG